MNEQKMVDHLFRHQYGKMVAILTRLFGLSNLELVEDAIQDTFAQAVQVFGKAMPENPEAWLTKAAKNRAIDLLRQTKAIKNRHEQYESGPSAILLDDLFLDHEIEDSQLRMVFTACHPELQSQDQLSFALKTIAGFGTREIAAALLLKEETVKKRLSRARKTVAEKQLAFEIPTAKELPQRLHRVHEVIYLTFNEGFHSANKQQLIREDLCGEALRLCQLLLKKELMRTGEGYALFALLCFHSARLPSRVNEQNELITLRDQDRSKWHTPLIKMGNSAMRKAMEYEGHSSFQIEAAIAAEHVQAPSFEETNWEAILSWYEALELQHPQPLTALNKAIVLLQLKRSAEAKLLLDKLSPASLEQRAYLHHATVAEYYTLIGQVPQAIESLAKALELVNNESERRFLEAKMAQLRA